MILLVCIVGLACTQAPTGVVVDFSHQVVTAGSMVTPFDTASLALAGPVLTVSQGIFRSNFE